MKRKIFISTLSFILCLSLLRADADRDGEVTVLDAALIQRWLADIVFAL